MKKIITTISVVSILAIGGIAYSINQPETKVSKLNTMEITEAEHNTNKPELVKESITPNVSVEKKVINTSPPTPITVVDNTTVSVFELIELLKESGTNQIHFFDNRSMHATLKYLIDGAPEMFTRSNSVSNLLSTWEKCLQTNLQLTGESCLWRVAVYKDVAAAMADPSISFLQE